MMLLSSELEAARSRPSGLHSTAVKGIPEGLWKKTIVAWRGFRWRTEGLPRAAGAGERGEMWTGGVRVQKQTPVLECDKRDFVENRTQ